MLLHLDETCFKEKANHTARLPQSTLTSGSLPISSRLTHRTLLQLSTVQRSLTYSFAIWVGVFQRLCFMLVTANMGQYGTNFDSEWLYQCNKIYSKLQWWIFHEHSDRCLYEVVNHIQEVGLGETQSTLPPTTQFLYKLSCAKLPFPIPVLSRA